MLRAAYDATLAAAACKSAVEGGRRVRVFLTALGDGAFGNRAAWIVDALQAALEAHREQPLDVVLVHYGSAVRSEWAGLGIGYYYLVASPSRVLSSSIAFEGDISRSSPLAQGKPAHLLVRVSVNRRVATRRSISVRAADGYGHSADGKSLRSLASGARAPSLSATRAVRLGSG